MARPQAKINLDDLERIASLAATQDEAAHFMKVTRQTIENRLKNDPEARAAWERGQSTAKLSVRRHLYRQAENGSAAAAIFLAKNLLGYRDHFDHRIGDPEGKPLFSVAAIRAYMQSKKDTDEAR